MLKGKKLLCLLQSLSPLLWLPESRVGVGRQTASWTLDDLTERGHTERASGQDISVDLPEATGLTGNQNPIPLACRSPLVGGTSEEFPQQTGDCPEQVGDRSRWKLSLNLNIHRHWQNKAEFHSNYSFSLGKQEIIYQIHKKSKRLVLGASSLEADCPGEEILNKMLQADAFIAFILNWDAILQEDVLINFIPFPSSGDGFHQRNKCKRKNVKMQI